MKVFKFGVTEVVVRINEDISSEHREILTHQVNNLKGISTVLMSDQKPHLMRVSYNPQTINSQQILEVVKNTGIHAQL